MHEVGQCVVLYNLYDEQNSTVVARSSRSSIPETVIFFVLGCE